MKKTVIKYFYAKAYVKSSPIQFICLSKKIDLVIDQHQRSTVISFLDSLTPEFITKTDFLDLFFAIHNPVLDYSVLNSYIVTLLFPFGQDFIHRDIAQMMAFGLLYSQSDEAQSELFLMWVLQVSKKQHVYKFVNEPDYLRENRLVVLELEAQLIHQIVGIYISVGKPKSQQCVIQFRKLFEEYQSIRTFNIKKN
jgi:hypothetical protein